MLKTEQTEMTTRGQRPVRDLLCYKCGNRRPGIFTVNANGQQVCPECAGSIGSGVLQTCDPENCACGKVEDGEPE